LALLDAFEATLDRRYIDAAQRATGVMIGQFADSTSGGFFDRPSSAAPLGGLDVRRKPFQDSPTPGGNAAAAILLDRLDEYIVDEVYRKHAAATLDAFARIAPEYGLHAATYGLGALLHARGAQRIVITGVGGDPAAQQLERIAVASYHFGRGVLRATPGRELAEIIPQTNVETAQAFVCVGTSCQAPVSDPAELKALLARLA
jgi:uncharacterized protein YyaL (SSP411 family)